MEIGDRIKLLRKNLKLTQAEFGTKIGLKPTAILMYEKGLRNVSEQSIVLITKTFNVCEEWLRSGAGDMYLPMNDIIIDDPSLDEADRKILTSYIQMTPKQRKFIKSWIKDIASSIENADQATDKRAEAHRLIDEQLDAEEKAQSASSSGASDTTEKRA